MNTPVPEIHIYCWDFKSGGDLEFDNSLAHMKPQAASYMQSFSSQFQQQRTELQRAMADFEKRAQHSQMGQLEQQFLKYLSWVKGLFNSCGLIQPDDFMPGQFPLQYLRYVATYKWTGSLCSDGSISSKKDSLVGINDAVYEMVSMLFNLSIAHQKCAAMRLAESLNDESLKEAYQLFARMAGIFEYIKPLVSEINQQKPILLDVQPATLDALTSVVMAQLQECAMARLAGKDDKEVLLAKLCKDTSDKFGEAYRYFESFITDTWRHKDRTDMFQLYCRLKEQVYLAKCYALMGYDFNSKEDNGKALFCCRKAVEILKSIEKDVARYEKRLEKRHSPRRRSMKAFFTEVQTYATARLEAFERENSMVFHATVPASLAEEIPSQSMGKPVALAEIMASPFFDVHFYDMFGQRRPIPGQEMSQSQMMAPPKGKKDCVIQ